MAAIAQAAICRYAGAMKEFNIIGHCFEARHYMVDITGKITAIKSLFIFEAGLCIKMPLPSPLVRIRGELFPELRGNQGLASSPIDWLRPPTLLDTRSTRAVLSLIERLVRLRNHPAMFSPAFLKHCLAILKRQSLLRLIGCAGSILFSVISRHAFSSSG
jgi:hypothetical protein